MACRRCPVGPSVVCLGWWAGGDVGMWWGLLFGVLLLIPVLGVTVEAMSKYGGTVLRTSLSKQGEQDLQDALHGTSTA